MKWLRIVEIFKDKKLIKQICLIKLKCSLQNYNKNSFKRMMSKMITVTLNKETIIWHNFTLFCKTKLRSSKIRFNCDLTNVRFNKKKYEFQISEETSPAKRDTYDPKMTFHSKPWMTSSVAAKFKGESVVHN
jgi:hypothetical protein